MSLSLPDSSRYSATPNVLPTHATPITKWEDRDEAFAIVARHIRETVEQLNAQKLVEQKAQERQGQQLLAQMEAEQKTERERLQRKQQRQADEQERLRQAERLKQQEAESAEEQRQELERQRRKEEIRRQLTVKMDELASERGIDYTRLQALLKAGQWKEADQETADRMCEVMGRQQEGWLREEDIQNFPCADLRTIDQLWVQHSQGRFGFSVQKKIWQACGSPTEYNANWEKFGEAVGWKKKGFLGMNKDWISNDEVTFNTSAPKGHLPSGFKKGWWGELWLSSSLASRLVN